ncbi:hypothetical protein [Hungatella effluvii]|nr:hypothetical protein [Hungatella effluvii]
MKTGNSEEKTVSPDLMLCYKARISDLLGESEAVMVEEAAAMP